MAIAEPACSQQITLIEPQEATTPSAGGISVRWHRPCSRRHLYLGLLVTAHPIAEASDHRCRPSGRGDRPGDLATVGLNDCVTAVLDDANHAGFAKFALVGHSVGGVTITETAYRHPDRVSHLIYVGAFVPGPGSTVARVHPMIGADVPDGVMEPPGEEITHTLFGDDLCDEE